ncbi:hypothetical protein CC86DRAFT_431599 [Ophiobolus disseminans]|uniref:Uncharacterized protein n=1 Tax=Ophiobolus disseminans TaxID=1469910 RepID=A0A6A7AEJ4_9PLEO|nr:hypothetical protein CC86DRAFT_431599 [Ophiobolus disseminans]
MANCLGDTDLCHQPYFAPYALPTLALHPDSSTWIDLPIGDVVRIPLVAIRQPLAGLLWRGRMVRNRDNGTLVAPEINHIMAALDPRMYMARLGSLNIVRKDKKPLSVIHVEALCRHCLDITEPIPHPTGPYISANQAVHDEYFDKQWQLLQTKASRDGFRAYWDAAKAEAEQMCPEGGFIDITYPYDI